MAVPARPNNHRLYLLGGMLLIWALAICLAWSICKSSPTANFEQRAQHQQQRTIEVAARRGIIYDRAGHELAMSISVESAFAVPSEIPDLASTLSLVSRITKDDPRELLAQCEGHKTFCWVARKADAETAEPHSRPESARHSLPERIRSGSIPSVNWPRRCSATWAPTMRD